MLRSRLMPCKYPQYPEHNYTALVVLGKRTDLALRQAHRWPSARAWDPLPLPLHCREHSCYISRFSVLCTWLHGRSEQQPIPEANVCRQLSVIAAGCCSSKSMYFAVLLNMY